MRTATLLPATAREAVGCERIRRPRGRRRPPRSRFVALALVALCGALIGAGCSSGPSLRAGDEFATREEFDARAGEIGLRAVGTFHSVSFPATVVNVVRGEGEVAFTLPGQGEQSYGGTPGVELTAVVFEDAIARPFGIVLRPK